MKRVSRGDALQNILGHKLQQRSGVGVGNAMHAVLPGVAQSSCLRSGMRGAANSESLPETMKLIGDFLLVLSRPLVNYSLISAAAPYSKSTPE